MSTKTVALETSVYQKLAREKRESESFTRTINRLLETGAVRGTCADAVREARALWGKPLAASEARKMESVIRDNRRRVDWDVETPE